MPSKPAASRKKRGVTYDTVRALALQLPGVDEGTSYGTSALKVAGKLFIRLKEDGETIVLRTDSLEREHLTRTAPKTFFVTDHYRDYPWVLVRLTSITRAQLAPLVEDAWRRMAPKRWLATHDSARATKR
jgi:hypothetical protein